MTLRTGHGKGKGVPRVEVMPPDELPAPVAAPEAVPSVPLAFRQDGKIATSETARALGRRGGEVKAARARLVAALGLVNLDSDAAFAPYRDAGDAFVAEHLSELAMQAGGEVGAGPASIVCTAGIQLAASRFLTDRGMRDGDAKLLGQGSALGNDSRQNLLAAYELAIREAKARADASRRPGKAAWFKKDGAK